MLKLVLIGLQLKDVAIPEQIVHCIRTDCPDMDVARVPGPGIVGFRCTSGLS